MMNVDIIAAIFYRIGSDGAEILDQGPETAALAALLPATVILLHTDLARRAFFELFAYVKDVEVLGPTIVREFPADSPYENWLKQARLDVPMLEGLMLNVMNSEEFLEQNSFVFSKRYDGAADYFGRVENARKLTHSKNFVDDVPLPGD